MEVREAIYRRQSIRAFTSQPVSKKTLLQLVDAAIQAPSARNLQPWQFIVVTGKARERLVQRLSSRYTGGTGPGCTTAGHGTGRALSDQGSPLYGGITACCRPGAEF